MIDLGEIYWIIAIYEDLSERYTAIIETFSKKELNLVPFSGSWTAGQVIHHIGKANDSSFLLTEGTTADRDIAEQNPMLKREFLNFDVKMKSPEFLVPESREYSKQEIMDLVQSRFQSLIENLPHHDLTKILDTPLGFLTKWELANFIVFHSRRHLHQLEKIQKAMIQHENLDQIDEKSFSIRKF